MVLRRRLDVPPGLPVAIATEEDAERETSVVVEYLLHVGDWKSLPSWSSNSSPFPSSTFAGRFLEDWD